MKRILIFYGTQEFKGSVFRLKKEAENLKLFDKILAYSPQDLPSYIKASPLMNFKKGGGYWLWKPYIIWKTLQDNPSSCVIYIDAGCVIAPSADWEKYFNLIKNHDTILFQYRRNFDYKWDRSWPSSTVSIIDWTKSATQEYFDSFIQSQEWHNFEKIMGGFIICKNADNDFIRQWLNISLFNPSLVMDPYGIELVQQNSSFIEHRHDQSIITPLAYYYVNKNGKLKILLETAESKEGSPAITASRMKSPIEPTFVKKILIKVKCVVYKYIVKSSSVKNKYYRYKNEQ